MYIYFDDGVQPSTCVHTCSTIEEAKQWISKQLQGFTMVDDTHPCSDDVFSSSRTAVYVVFGEELYMDLSGAPITIDEDGIRYLTEPIFVSDYFYTE